MTKLWDENAGLDLCPYCRAPISPEQRERLETSAQKPCTCQLTSSPCPRHDAQTDRPAA